MNNLNSIKSTVELLDKKKVKYTLYIVKVSTQQI